jgi:hypothetical protein
MTTAIFSAAKFDFMLVFFAQLVCHFSSLIGPMIYGDSIVVREKVASGSRVTFNPNMVTVSISDRPKKRSASSGSSPSFSDINGLK